jgi:hypothetical protein
LVSIPNVSFPGERASGGMLVPVIAPGGRWAPRRRSSFGEKAAQARARPEALPVTRARKGARPAGGERKPPVHRVEDEDRLRPRFSLGPVAASERSCMRPRRLSLVLEAGRECTDLAAVKEDRPRKRWRGRRGDINGDAEKWRSTSVTLSRAAMFFYCSSVSITILCGVHAREGSVLPSLQRGRSLH